MRNQGVLIAIVLLIAGALFWYGLTREPVVPASTTTQVKPGVSDYSYVNASGDTVLVDLPTPGAVVGKKFSIMGKARGTWYFEASFPYQILGADGTVLAQGPVTAGADWMTNEFVPFKVDVTVPDSYIGPATLILHKDNPSGDLKRDASVSFPIIIEY